MQNRWYINKGGESYKLYDRDAEEEAKEFFIFFFIILSAVRLRALGTAATIGLLYQMIDDCGAIGGMKTGRENRSTRTKPAPVPLCSPQIPYDLTQPGLEPGPPRWEVSD
jgi:hypothetical protein